MNAVVELRPASIGSLIDKLSDLREKKRGLEEKVNELKSEMEVIEQQLMDQMEAEGVQKSTGKKATASVGTSVVPNVEDWDSFYQYIHRHKYYHLLERRPSVTGCRELFENKGKIPGVVPFVKRKLNLTNLRSA